MKRIILVSIFLIVGCSEQIREEITERYSDGKKKTIMKFIGKGSEEVMVEKILYSQNGDTLLLEKPVDKIKIVREYYENGQIKIEESYKDEKKHGRWIYDYEIGGDKVKLESFFLNGLKSGEWKVLQYDLQYENYRTIGLIGKYERDKKIGVWRICSPSYRPNYECVVFDLNNVNNYFPEIGTINNILKIRIIAAQFVWYIHYSGPDGIFGETELQFVDREEGHIGLNRYLKYSKDDIVTINQLHIPSNTNIILEITSLGEWTDGIDGVNHSLLIPQLNVYQDAIPDEWKVIFLNTQNEGEFTIHCTEYCGNSAFRHRGFLTIEPVHQFEAWLEEQDRKMKEEYIDDDDDDW